MVSIDLPMPFEPFEIQAMSDLHVDEPGHARALLMRDLEEAREFNRKIFINGDIWSMIFPKDIRRFTGAHSMGQVDALIDHAVTMAFKILEPYADLIVFIGAGNHETAVIKYHHTDPVNRLREKLQSVRDPELPPIRHGGYTGFIRIRLTASTRSYTDIWYYHHGKGGGAPVTRGMIDLQRVRADISADVYWFGHKHTAPSDTPTRKELNQYGRVVRSPVLAFFTPGYTGDIETQEYEEGGYILDWSEENFTATPSQGSAVISYIPRDTSDGIKVRKQIIREVA